MLSADFIHALLVNTLRVETYNNDVLATIYTFFGKQATVHFCAVTVSSHQETRFRVVRSGLHGRMIRADFFETGRTFLGTFSGLLGDFFGFFVQDFISCLNRCWFTRASIATCSRGDNVRVQEHGTKTQQLVSYLVR